MSSKANASSGSNHTQRHVSGRRNQPRRSAAEKHRSTSDQPVPTNTAAEKAPSRPESQRTQTYRTAGRPQELDGEKIRRSESATTTTTTTTTHASRELNAFSPAFVPKQYQQQGAAGAAEVNNALSFSSVTSPLAYLGSTGAPSSVASPLLFAASTAAVTRVGGTATPATPSLREPTSTPLAGSAGGGGSGVAGSTSAMQLRDAYARAAAAKASLSLSSANRDGQATSLTSPLVSQLLLPSPQAQTHTQQPHQQPQQSLTSYTFSATGATGSVGAASCASTPHPPQQQPHQHQHHHQQQQQQQQRSAARDTTASSAATAIYGPSVSVFHPQFIDVTTGATSMTPFALHDDYVDPDTAETAAAEEEGDDDREDAVAEEEAAAAAREAVRAIALQQQQQQQQQQQYELEREQQRQAILAAHQQQLLLQHQYQQKLQLQLQLQQQQQQQQHMQLQAAPPRRMSATTLAILASHDAPTAQLSTLPTSSTRRGSDRALPAMYTASAAVVQETSSPQPRTAEKTKDEPAPQAAQPAAAQQRRMPTTVSSGSHIALATTTTTAATAAEAPVAGEGDGQQTPKRQSRRLADATKQSGATLSLTADEGGSAATVERLYACLASTEERTEDGRSVASKMGLTGSVRRGEPTRHRSADTDRHDDDAAADFADSECATVTPTITPAKVLAAEGSPFVDAAAAENTTSAAAAAAAGSGAVSASAPRLNRRLLAEEDSAIVFSESTTSEAARGSRAAQQQQQQLGASQSGTGSDGRHLQRAMMQLMAQIQSNNGKSAATAATTAAAPSAKTAVAVTPQKPSSGAAAQSESTPASFKTPEIERVPSARPSASKNATCRTITTIIHTPNSTTTSTTTHNNTSNNNNTNINSSASGAAPAKSAQRSLASCLEAIATAKSVAPTATSTRDGATPSARQSQSAPSDAVAAAQTYANPAAMPVPRSQRRTARQAGGRSGSATDAVLNSSITSASTTATAQTHHTSAAPVQASPYAVVIDGHMGRRVTAVSATPLKSGVCVLFEEDRGIDMGRVVKCDALADGEATGALATLASATSPLSHKDRPAPVLRAATAEEEYRWLYADVKEAEATLEPCREAAARLGLPVKVVGAVYQFNKAKLTFYYESNTRVDFRPLLPSLFSRFHCRIWMSRVETPLEEGEERGRGSAAPATVAI